MTTRKRHPMADRGIPTDDTVWTHEEKDDGTVFSHGESFSSTMARWAREQNPEVPSPVEQAKSVIRQDPLRRLSKQLFHGLISIEEFNDRSRDLE